MRRLGVLACLILLAGCSGKTGDAGAEVDQSTGRIEGTVREMGTEVPIAGVRVFLVRTSDRPQIQTTSDADGRFALEGIESGRHLVALVREGYVVPGRQEISGYPFRTSTGESVENVEFHMIPSGTVAGRVFGPDGEPANRVEIQLLQKIYLMGNAQWSRVNRGGSGRGGPVVTNERGEFRALGVDPGDYVIRLVPQEASIASVIPGATSVSPMFYPGARDVKGAQSITVSPGRETLLEDITLRSERRAWIRVAVENRSGEPLEGLGSWRVGPPGWVGAEYALADQRFVNNYHEIQPDSPGTYDIVATWSTPLGPVGGKLRVNYLGKDLEVRLSVAKPETSLTGKVVFEQAGAAPAPITGVEVAFGTAISYFARSGPEGILTVPALYKGSYQFGYIRGLPADSFVESVRQGSRDVFQEGIVAADSQEPVAITVRSGAPALEGQVRDDLGMPVHNALVALVPDSPLRARMDYYGAYQDTRTDQHGEFSIHGITPGSYRAYAWRDAPASAYRSEEFMQEFEGRGSTLALSLNEQAHVDLRVIDVVP